MSKRVQEYIDLEKKIAVQEDALIDARSDGEARLHGALLERLTNRWCRLTATMTDAEMYEVSLAMGVPV